MTNAIRAQGTKLQHGVLANSPPYSDLEEARDIKMGGTNVSAIDATHLLSTSKEFLAGLKDNGTVDMNCNFTNGTVQQAMRLDYNNGTTAPYKIVITGSSVTITIAFSAFITKYDGPDAGVDGKLDIAISMKITGDVTITSV